ncbi:alpha/beta hydrolase [[Mycobacterium] wendilense]|uniref:Alpha/beta hydrolase n=1 Tax=[Mycobacterium] wendilense TaxID=3064284 RepID=A0ABN9P105_9MYCO|nr:alpha/beta hydrolase [Mycolicibacterium sp. MU0050]CAJ1581813.1 alpha/beta hydrolase [Mycolicibacterium sp. MU0050]
MTTPQRLTIEVPHLRFEALTWGPDDGRLMLCLHGYPDTAWTWRHLGPHFAEQGFRVVAPFMRGYAPTELARDGDYGVGELMRDALALHQNLGGGADAVLVGHDWGGLTANGLAAYPQNPFAKVVSMGVPLVTGLQPGSGHGAAKLRLLPRQLKMSWYIFFQQLPGISERNLDRVLPKLWRDWCPPGYDTGADLDHLWQSLSDPSRRTAALSYYRAVFRPLRRGRHHRELDRYAMGATPVRHPMLVLHGRLDGAIDARLAALSVEGLPAGSAHQIIDGAGHFMHLDRPAEVHRLIGDYVRSS